MRSLFGFVDRRERFFVILSGNVDPLEMFFIRSLFKEVQSTLFASHHFETTKMLLSFDSPISGGIKTVDANAYRRTLYHKSHELLENYYA